jgi:hypothetical protein
MIVVFKTGRSPHTGPVAALISRPPVRSQQLKRAAEIDMVYNNYKL